MNNVDAVNLIETVDKRVFIQPVGTIRRSVEPSNSHGSQGTRCRVVSASRSEHRRTPQTPGNKYLYAKLANKHCLNDRGSRIFRLDEGSLAALMSSRRNRRDHRGSSSENGNEAWQRGLKEEEHMAGRAEQRERERERNGEKKSRTRGTRTDLLRYL